MIVVVMAAVFGFEVLGGPQILVRLSEEMDFCFRDDEEVLGRCELLSSR